MFPTHRSDRPAKLIRFFKAVLKGGRSIEGTHGATHFLEGAISFGDSNGPSMVVESLIGSKAGLESLRIAVRKSFERDFVMSSTIPFLRLLSHSQIKILGDGYFLTRILEIILDPRTLWLQLVKLHSEGSFRDDETLVFTWLCLEVVLSESKFGEHCDDVRGIMAGRSLLEASSHEIRVLACRIQKVLSTTSAVNHALEEYGPGGRHDNDFDDFRDISIFPTSDEVLCKEKPFLQRLDDVFASGAPPDGGQYLGWMFRLLREDMLHELRNDLRIATDNIRGRTSPLSFGLLRVVREDISKFQPRAQSWTLALECSRGMEFLRGMTLAQRSRYLDSPNAVFKHGSLGALCHGNKVIAFGSVLKDRSVLLEGKTILGLQMVDAMAMKTALSALCGPEDDRHNLALLVINTPTFAYEPILQSLKQLKEVPLDSHILRQDAETELVHSENMQLLLRKMSEASRDGANMTISRPQGNLVVGGAQLESLINGLRRPLAQIQGPPGTGKSFIGALLVRFIVQHSGRRVLVLSYTNHALDQFLSELVDIGVDQSSIVRLGSKSSAETESMRLESKTKQSTYRPSLATCAAINSLKEVMHDHKQLLGRLRQSLSLERISAEEAVASLEFSEDSSFWTAFQVPKDEDGFRFSLRGNREVTPRTLYSRWRYGKRYPLDESKLSRDNKAVWSLAPIERQTLDEKWCRQVRQEQISQYVALAEEANEVQSKLNRLFNEKKRHILREMRVIGCTTTGAAMQQSLISSSEPDVVIVEEAGEILEAHVVAALSPSVQQLILIGDHKQLRPKVNNYDLTFEKGDGFDLNVSLFERLIRQNNPYTALQKQHRSHPDISHYARLLAYEHLQDDPETLSREAIRGLKNRVVFVHHEHPEDEVHGSVGKSEQGMTFSKQNFFEARMVLKTVRYLAQQGYSSKDLVVLTPYLGQLRLLKDQLSDENDPVLNDLDSHELLRAGLMTSASANVHKPKLRLSTIDNYQGEESDIVIVSLTRSNANGDIGFMYARERLVVLMSRARKGIILFGNMHTFIKSKKGHALWSEFFDALKEKNSLFDGLPVFCARHPHRSTLLSRPEDFDRNCPDGGCAETCGRTLCCGKHACQRRCHRGSDHSKTQCYQMVDQSCDRGHNYKLSCGQESQGCTDCAREDAENRRRALRDLEMERARQERQMRFKSELQDLNDQIDQQKRAIKYQNEEQEQKKLLEGKKSRLQDLRATKARIDQIKELESKGRALKQTLPGHFPKMGRHNQASPKQQPMDVSTGAKAEWELEKQNGGRNAALDKLMNLIGLESIKDEFLSSFGSIKASIKQGVKLSEERFSCSLLGNPGTGKTTVARIWAEFLTHTAAIPGSVLKETTGSKLASQGVSGCERMIEDIKDDGGGVLFIDEAYQLSSGNSGGGKAVLDFLLAEVENLRGKVVFILAGYDKEMESFFAHNPGLPSRFPITFKFEDYTDDELLRIFQRQINEKFRDNMQIEGGTGGLYARIVARRIGHGRGKPGFGNARAVENAIDRIRKRQSKRIRQAKKENTPFNELCLTKHDLIGPEPRAALDASAAWKRLNEMVGLAKVKEELNAFRDTVVSNYHRELDEEPVINFSLNRVFVGAPGTGKTTVAKLYGEILAHLGLLSNGEVVVKNPSDFVGSALGQSESQTKGILASTVGKVLVIDEAYGLYGGGGVADPYKTAVIDTIVAEVQSVPGDDRCVLLLGYEEQMQTMFQKVNPGLSRRFPLDAAFVFEDFDDDALSKILDLKLRQAGFSATGAAKSAALEVLRKARNRANFGNAGEIDILLNKAKASHQKRSKHAKNNTFDAVDFDSDFDRATRETDVKALFSGDVGRERVIQLLERLQRRVRELKKVDMDPREETPFSFLFRGPPGTGKTTTARKMGKVYYDMGFLAAAEVIECSASDLIGQYVGQTAPKVIDLMDRALGKVLFIDEAYRLSGDHFAKEAVDELVDCVTKPKYQGKLIIILAGYVEDINKLLSVNPGMSSRFPETVDFEPLSSIECFQLLYSTLENKKRDVERNGKLMLDISCLEHPCEAFQSTILELFKQLSSLKGWANGRDVKQISKSIFRLTPLTTDKCELRQDIVVREVRKFLAELSHRASTESENRFSLVGQSLLSRESQPFLRPLIGVENVCTVEEEAAHGILSDAEGDSSSGQALQHGAIRDAGVSDEVWQQLKKDEEAEAQQEMKYRELKESYKRAADQAREKLIKEILEEEDRRNKEAAMKARLAQMGRCPAGYAWIKQAGGYRCAGGSHFVTMEENLAAGVP